MGGFIGNLAGGLLGGIGGGGGGGDTMANTKAAQAKMSAETDKEQAATLEAQTAAMKQKEAMNRWQIAQDSQTDTFKTMQEVNTNRLKTADKCTNAFASYIRGGSA